MPASSDASMAANALLSSTGPQPPPTAHSPVPITETLIPDLPSVRVASDLTMFSTPLISSVQTSLSAGCRVRTRLQELQTCPALRPNPSLPDRKGRSEEHTPELQPRFG